MSSLPLFQIQRKRENTKNTSDENNMEEGGQNYNLMCKAVSLPVTHAKGSSVTERRQETKHVSPQPISPHSAGK